MALGRAAVEAARPGWFPLGARGAGMSATVGNAAPLTPYGWETSGQGAAFRQFGETRILAISVVNALGGIFERDGRIVRGFRHGETGERRALEDVMTEWCDHDRAGSGNTTLTVIVTNQKFDRFTQGQIARQVHVAMGRMIRPFHTIFDGDVLFMVSTEEIDNPKLGPITLGELAADALWDAVLAAVPPDV
jgi:L-aminopeptidase/D-esterase-like protein